jgi:hypothetical protein
MFWTQIVNLRMTWNRSKHVVLYNEYNLVVFGRFRLDSALGVRNTRSLQLRPCARETQMECVFCAVGIHRPWNSVSVRPSRSVSRKLVINTEVTATGDKNLGNLSIFFCFENHVQEHQGPLVRRDASIRLHGVTFRKRPIFIINDNTYHVGALLLPKPLALF